MNFGAIFSGLGSFFSALFGWEKARQTDADRADGASLNESKSILAGQDLQRRQEQAAANAPQTIDDLESKLKQGKE